MSKSMTHEEQLLARDVGDIGKIQAIERILEVACRATKTGFAVVARVTPTRWIAGAVRDEIELGLVPGSEIAIKATLCDGVRRTSTLVAIDDLAKDEVFCGHPTLVGMGIQSYISVPIVLSNGEFFGTLCALDRSPKHLNSPEIIGMFTLFAELIAQHLDSMGRLERSEEALFSERATSVLREEFIAVLGHDLRNPLAAILVSSAELEEPQYGQDANEIGSMIRDCAGRMNLMIADVLDLAQGRLGGGLEVSPVETRDLAQSFTQVIEELQVANPQRTIQQDIHLPPRLRVDGPRLLQLVSNLVANAITHGDHQSPVWVRARTHTGQFWVEVVNRGDPIPDEVAAQLFQPFRRAAARRGQEGLGLGLYIASEIANGHGGTLEMAQSDGEIRFVFRMPIRSGQPAPGMIEPIGDMQRQATLPSPR